VEAIKAIYQDEFTPLKPPSSVWKVVRPDGRPPLPYFALKLFPDVDNDELKELVWIELEVKFIRNYPLDPPELSIGKSAGIPLEKVPDLLKSLRSKARSLSGQEMIYDLATEVQGWIAINHNAPSVSKSRNNVLSSYERMQDRQAKEMERKERERKQAMLELERKNELEQIKKSEELLRHLEEEQHKRREEFKRRRRKNRDSIMHLPQSIPWYQLEPEAPVGTRFHLGQVVALSPDDPDSPLLEHLLVLRRVTLPESWESSDASSTATKKQGKSVEPRMLSISNCARFLCTDLKNGANVFVHYSLLTQQKALSTVNALKPLCITSSSATLHPNICQVYDYLLHQDDDEWSVITIEESCGEQTLGMSLSRLHILPEI
jgi:hypothetical protein